MLKGTIIKNVSNQYVVNTKYENYTCVPRGIFRHEKIVPLVGDRVLINEESLTIEEIFKRTNYLERPSVANIEYGLIITSFVEPDFNSMLLDKLIVKFLSKNVKPVLIFTKLDKCNKEEIKNYKEVKKYYMSLGYKVLSNKNLFRIKRFLKNKTAFVAGQTGAGKSTLLNRLDKKLKIDTKPISKALGRGVHTTRHTELYKISNFYIADTPGFSSITVDDIKKDELKDYFVEFKNYKCKFKDCNHLNKNCEVYKNKESNKLFFERYKNYEKMMGEIDEGSSKLYK